MTRKQLLRDTILETCEGKPKGGEKLEWLH